MFTMSVFCIYCILQFMVSSGLAHSIVHDIINFVYSMYTQIKAELMHIQVHKGVGCVCVHRGVSTYILYADLLVICETDSSSGGGGGGSEV